MKHCKTIVAMCLVASSALSWLHLQHQYKILEYPTNKENSTGAERRPINVEKGPVNVQKSHNIMNASMINTAMDRTARMIFDYHFSKTGGGTLCNLANSNRESIDPARKGSCGSPVVSSYSNCEERNEMFEILMQHNFTYVRQETDFKWFADCPSPQNVLTMTAIRHPLSRLASNWMFRITKQGCCDYLYVTPREMLQSHSSVALMPNFQCRQAVGRQNLNLPTVPSQCTDALARLSQIDVVFPTERMCEAVPVLERKYGWKDFSMLNKGKGVDSDSHVAGTRHLKTFGGEDDVTEMLKENAGDILLWNEANRRLDEDLRELGITGTQNCPEVQYDYIPLDKVQIHNKELVMHARKKEHNHCMVALKTLLRLGHVTDVTDGHKTGISTASNTNNRTHNIYQLIEQARLKYGTEICPIQHNHNIMNYDISKTLGSRKRKM